MTKMAITLELPFTLQRQLQHLASFEGISLDRFILYTLTERANETDFYTLTDEELAIEREKFAQFREKLRPASDEEFEAVMAMREPANPDPDYPPELQEKVQAMLAKAKAQKQRQKV